MLLYLEYKRNYGSEEDEKIVQPLLGKAIRIISAFASFLVTNIFIIVPAGSGFIPKWEHFLPTLQIGTQFSFKQHKYWPFFLLSSFAVLSFSLSLCVCLFVCFLLHDGSIRKRFCDQRDRYYVSFEWMNESHIGMNRAKQWWDFKVECSSTMSLYRSKPIVVLFEKRDSLKKCIMAFMHVCECVDGSTWGSALKSVRLMLLHKQYNSNETQYQFWDNKQKPNY